jgi:hypothetical protein
MSKLDKTVILIGAVGAIVLVVEEPMTGGSWATATRQPAGHEPSLFHVSAKGDHQAQGRGL